MSFAPFSPFRAFGGGAVQTPYNPEQGLTLTNTVDVGYSGRDKFDAGQTSQHCVFALDITIPTSPVGMIHKVGGNVVGLYVGFRTNHTFVLRAGNGQSLPRIDAAALEITSGQPSGVGVLVYEVDVVNWRVRAWWNGLLLGQNSSGPWPGNRWAGSGPENYMLNADSGYPVGEIPDVLPATASSLRFYANQLVA